MKTLVGIPVLYNGLICLQAFKSVIDEADLLIIDNGSEDDVKQAITLMSAYNDISHRVSLIRNAKNEYVTFAWNQILAAFLDSNCPHEHLVIMNSDMVMQPGWSKHLIDGVSCVTTNGSHKVDTEVTEGVPGVFIHLNKAMARLVYPISATLRIWFGDTFIYNTLYKHGYKTVIKAGLIGDHVHNGSMTVKRLPEFQEVIQRDMIEWETIKYII